MVVLALVPHPVPSEAAQQMLEQPGGTLDGALGEVFVLEPAGDRSQRCVVPGLAVREPLVEIGRATSELQSPCNLVCRLLLEKKKSSGRLSPSENWNRYVFHRSP